jgi:DNA-binding LytR/AlgR family response regulator
MSRNNDLIRGLIGNETLHFRYNHKMECIFIKDIAYIESERAYSKIYIKTHEGFDKKLICRSSGFLKRRLADKGFIRCKRSFLVNTLVIEHFCSVSRTLSVSGCQLPVSRRLSGTVFGILLQRGIKDVSETKTELY